MHRKFAAWLSERPWTAGFCTSVFGVLSLFGLVPFAVAAGAVSVFVLLHKGAEAGIRSALSGTLWFGGLVLVMTASLSSTVATVGALIWLPLLLALLLKRYGSLRLCFQVTVLIAWICLGLLYLALDDATAQWQALIRLFVEPLRQAGMKIDEQQLTAVAFATNWGTYVAMLLLSVLGALFLGRWWQTLLDSNGAFGTEYQQLRFGSLLGAFAVLAIVGGLAANKLGYDVPLVEAWIWVAVVGFAFQGLAAAHRLKALGSMGRGGLTAIYVLLIVPISTSLMVVLLAGWGLADNWRRTRAPSA